ncbi:MAG: hypothetical protein KUG70_14370 [Rhodobacteraceae bacterium]|nr:hypothetical protein [Paracoccaceae bacterium]
MATAKKTNKPGSKAAAGRAPNARTRLKALKARRASVQPTPSAGNPAEAAAGGGGLAAILGGGAPSEMQRKILMQVYGILTQSSGSETKMVAGTQFSEEGVEDLMNKLRKRSADESQKGSKVAGMMLSFLDAKDGEENTIAGASMDKIRVLSGAANRVVKGK